MIKYLVGCLILLSINSMAQSETQIDLGRNKIFKKYGTETNTTGKVTVTHDTHVDEMLQKHSRMNKKAKGINGWRVQIYFSSGRDAMNTATKIKTDFEETYPEIPTYLVYQAPYFKVRVGDFRKNEKSKAIKLKQEISNQFTSIWIVEDLITLPKL